ncbi:NACHT domain-containing protein [Reyranella aquatilis]|uniref:NACHT domain-containing protein n=1 Tax=Reyranella aquatilis TaxID=2035356 RepID=A0ABS8L186_9HYPH|nr:NACHT domain-containing protein [Reyranella aquatilis]MCC8432100.1 NACHT domain-containing protein [Reyranella aquatilis]
MAATGVRLPAVPSLSALLPKGTESGKEFARIVGLLLFQDARRVGREFIMFDDASGDYEGLDSFSRRSKSENVIGYQYKFFPSPLSDEHRKEIRASARNAKTRSKNLKLTKYVVVTPDDLTNSGRRAEGGDVTWFENLRNEFKSTFEIEHLGHSKLQSLFLQSPHLCLFYYPRLVPRGEKQRKSIQEIRSLYDLNLKKRYGRIEFVGMSVYKEEASRRIPLENIYIPLSVVSERSPEESDDTPRVDPGSFLAPGNKTVLLGDPGSGKSTLLSFLALCGISEALQKRCNTQSDSRLTVVVVLRRYADELKKRRNLPLLDFLVETVKADFNLDAFSTDFLEYYFESGQAVILFDGLDELPSSTLKTVIRKRIEAFNETYPANTIVVSSRIVGYEAEVRFDDAFSHYRVAKLRLPEIKRFILDWYAARLEDESDRKRNADDLVKVITNPDNDAIRSLARNPLLLTIVALVHRIDAVLPDQRVVLYQKCTETLLNTWHKAKQKDEEIAKGRIERRNRHRIEAIAYWMHRRSIAERSRAVAPYSDLVTFLTQHITDNEQPSSEPAEDQAEAFLEFIKTGAGLLIEAGDTLYSFIHMTFQEYLSATHLISFGEMDGTDSIWKELGGDLDNPRWREVVRLLVASLRSTSGQKFFVDKLLDFPTGSFPSRDRALLIVGLLRDGIEPAEEKAQVIVEKALQSLQTLDSPDDIVSLQSSIRAWSTKDAAHSAITEAAASKVFESSASRQKFIIALARPALDLRPSDSKELSSLVKTYSDQASAYESLILGTPTTMLGWEPLMALHDLWATQSPETNAAAAIGLGLSALLDSTHIPARLLRRELIVFGTGEYGPHNDHFQNLISIAMAGTNIRPELKKALFNSFRRSNSPRRRRVRPISSLIAPHTNGLIRQEMDGKRDNFAMLEHIRPFLEAKVENLNVRSLGSAANRSKRGDHAREEIDLIKDTFRLGMEESPGSYWDMLWASEIFSEYVIASVISALNLRPIAHWKEGLRGSLKARIPALVGRFFDEAEWETLSVRLKEGNFSSDDQDFAAWLVLLDLWVWQRDGYVKPTDSPLIRIVEAAQYSEHSLLRFSVALWRVSHQLPGANEDMQNLTAAANSRLRTQLESFGWPHPETKESSQRGNRQRRSTKRK